jgi:NAD-dependent deacetylase
MKKIVVFSGAGLDRESGIPTFRDGKDSMWLNYKINEVVTVEAWKNNPEKVHEFHNMLRAKLKDYKPNAAHIALVELEKSFYVTHVTQNVSNLLEVAGATNVLHLHGELYKSRSTLNPNTLYDCFGDINIDDKGPDGSRLRPHTVLFGEFPYNMNESVKAIRECHYLIIIGTGFDISYTAPMMRESRIDCKIFYVDPKPVKIFGIDEITYIKEPATVGVTKLVEQLLNNG